MKRDDWEFSYPADKLHQAAEDKNLHHEERLRWWEEKKQQVMISIKADGLEIDESQTLEYSKMSNFHRGTTVQVRDDLLRDLNECVAKIKEHSAKAEGYRAWIEVLSSQGQSVLSLNQDDWLYFFGK